MIDEDDDDIDWDDDEAIAAWVATLTPTGMGEELTEEEMIKAREIYKDLDETIKKAEKIADDLYLRWIFRSEEHPFDFEYFTSVSASINDRFYEMTKQKEKGSQEGRAYYHCPTEVSQDFMTIKYCKWGQEEADEKMEAQKTRLEQMSKNWPGIPIHTQKKTKRTKPLQRREHDRYPFDQMWKDGRFIGWEAIEEFNPFTDRKFPQSPNLFDSFYS